MTPAQETKGEIREMFPSGEVWLIDDDSATVKRILRFWQLKLKGLSFNFRHFPTAQAALAELEQRQQQQQELPQLIFIDGELEQDEGELRQGAAVVKKIRELDIAQPQLIAHSSLAEFNQEMMAAGADTAFKKLEINQSSEFLKKQAELLNKEA